MTEPGEVDRTSGRVDAPAAAAAGVIVAVCLAGARVVHVNASGRGAGRQGLTLCHSSAHCNHFLFGISSTYQLIEREQSLWDTLDGCRVAATKPAQVGLMSGRV